MAARLSIGTMALWIVSAIAASAAPALAQGETGFLRGRGNLDLAVSYSLDSYDEFWVDERRVSAESLGRIDRHTISLYAAYGLTDDLDLISSASYVRATSTGVYDDNQDFQDMKLALKWRVGEWELGPGRFSILAAPGGQFPLSDYNSEAFTAIGDGEWALLGRGILHYQFDAGAFVSLETGFDYRDGLPANEVPVNLTAGFSLFDRLTLSGFYSHVESLGGFNVDQGPFPGNQEEYDRIGGGIYFRINDRFGVSASAWTTLDGKNTGDVDGFSIGTVLKF